MSTRSEDAGRDVAFAVGTLVGMAVLAIGLATLILAVSVGLRRDEGYLTPDVRLALLAVGGLLVLAGVAVRLVRAAPPAGARDPIRTAGFVTSLVGLGVLLFGVSAETTVSAPFLATPSQKFVLFGIAYGLLVVGYLIVRSAARTVGW